MCTELGKKLLQFIWGFFIGIIFYTIIFKNVHISQQIRYFILLFTCLTCGLGSIVSIQIRCISILTLLTFCSNSGKSIVRAWIVLNLLEGPINNIAKNANEIVELTTCSVTLSYNLTKARFDLMLQPFLQASLRLKPDVSEINDTLRYIDKMVKPLTEEIEGANKSTSISDDSNIKMKNDDGVPKDVKNKNYLKKLESRCNVQIAKTRKKCEDVFRDQQRQCLYNIPLLIGAMYCWPFQLGKICDMSEALGITHVCDPSMQIDANVNEEHAKLLDDIKSLHRNMLNPNITYSNKYVNPNLYIEEMKNASITMVKKILEKKTMFEYVIDIISNLMKLLILKIVLDSQTYHNNYLRDVTFNNRFITKYFLKIDEKRRMKNKFTISSVKKLDNKDIIDPYNMTIRKFEYILLFKQLLKLSLEIVMASVLLILDRLFYEALNVIKRHGRVDYSQRGSHNISVKIKGTGMMARLIKSMIKQFDLKKTYSALKSNTECLPKAFLLESSFIYKIFAGYLIIFLFSLIQVYVTRLFSSVCGYFYPTQDKFRSIYIYNDILRNRYRFVKNIKNTVLKIAMDNRDRQRMRNQIFFKYFASNKCMICGMTGIIYFSLKSTVMWMCPNDMCGFVYCLDCWKAVGEVCHACELDDAIEVHNSTDSSVEVFNNAKMIGDVGYEKKSK